MFCLCVFQRLTTAGVRILNQRASRSFLMLYSQLFLTPWNKHLFLFITNMSEWTEDRPSSDPNSIAIPPFLTSSVQYLFFWQEDNRISFAWNAFSCTRGIDVKNQHVLAKKTVLDLNLSNYPTCQFQDSFILTPVFSYSQKREGRRPRKLQSSYV